MQMISSSRAESKKFYEKTTLVNERLQKCEATAMDLERKLFSKGDGFKLASEIFKYRELEENLQRVIADGEKSRARNMKILEKLSAVDRLMHSLGTKAEKLEALREEYINITRKLQALGNNAPPLWERTSSLDGKHSQSVPKSQLPQHWLDSVTESGIGSSLLLPSHSAKSFYSVWTQTDDTVQCPHCLKHVYEYQYQQGQVSKKSLEANHLYESRAISHIESLFPSDSFDTSKTSTRDSSHTLSRTPENLISCRESKRYQDFGHEIVSPAIPQGRDAREYPYTEHEKHTVFSDAVQRNSHSGRLHEYSHPPHIQENIYTEHVNRNLHSESVQENAYSEHAGLASVVRPELEITRSHINPHEYIQGPPESVSSNLANRDEDQSQCSDVKRTEHSVEKGNESGHSKSRLHLVDVPSLDGSNFHDKPSSNDTSGIGQYEEQNRSVYTKKHTSAMTRGSDEILKASSTETPGSDIHMSRDSIYEPPNANDGKHQDLDYPVSPPTTVQGQDMPALPSAPVSPVFSFYQQLDLDNQEYENPKNTCQETDKSNSNGFVSDSQNVDVRNANRTSSEPVVEQSKVVDDLQNAEKPVSLNVAVGKSSILCDNELDTLVRNSHVSEQSMLTAVQNQNRELSAREEPVANSDKAASPENTNSFRMSSDRPNRGMVVEPNQTQTHSNEERNANDSLNNNSEVSSNMDDVEDTFFDNDPPMIKESNAYRALLGIHTHHKESDSEDDIESNFTQSILSKKQEQDTAPLPSSLVSASVPSDKEHATSTRHTERKTNVEVKKPLSIQERNRIRQKVLLLGQGSDSDLEDSIKSQQKEMQEADDDFFD